jgi:hypothetical protein
MSELRQAVVVITEYAGSNTMDVPDYLGPAAEVYARACRGANERLAECDRLLRTGMRSEALRQVQLEPDALEVYKELAIRNADRWAEIAQQVGLSVPPRLNAEAARRLNEAFATEQKVKELLRQHRSLALSRAPLCRRLDIVRLLHRAEPVNLGWQDDIAAYEAARFEEMRWAIADPARRTDWDAVRALSEEISADVWVSPPPLDLVAMIQEAHAALRGREGRRLLAGINPRLLKAMNDGDFDAVEQLEREARGVAAQFAINDNDRSLDVAYEATAWLKAERKRRKQERDFQKMVEVLRGYLTDGTDWWYVQEQYRLVREIDLPIPADVLRLYAARARSRKLLWGLGVAGAVLVAAVGLTVYLAKL